MTDPKLSGDDKKKPQISMGRIAIWVIAAGVGLYLVISGLVGVVTKGG
jgi:hypothetical protein